MCYDTKLEPSRRNGGHETRMFRCREKTIQELSRNIVRAELETRVDDTKYPDNTIYSMCRRVCVCVCVCVCVFHYFVSFVNILWITQVVKS